MTGFSPGVSEGTLSTFWGVRRYFKYLLVSQEVLKVPPEVSVGTMSTSWGVGRYLKNLLVSQEAFDVRFEFSGFTL
jgi:hypothetical protein